MLAVVAYDPAAIPSRMSAQIVAVLACFGRRHELVLAFTERSAGDAEQLVQELRQALPRFCLVPLIAEPLRSQVVEPTVLSALLNEGAVPVVVGHNVAAVPMAAMLARMVDADLLLRLADGPDGVALQITEWAQGDASSQPMNQIPPLPPANQTPPSARLAAYIASSAVATSTSGEITAD